MLPQLNESTIVNAYAVAREVYASYGVDTDQALDILTRIPISLHCWQGDDIGGFDDPEGLTGGGIQTTGNYPGKARNSDELRQDLEKAYSLIPGRHRVNLHAMYAETNGRPVERSEIQPSHFERWADWANAQRLGIDFNPTPFSHPKANDGFTLSSYDTGIRRYWIEHCIASRKIAEYLGNRTGSPCVYNIWIPDGFKDVPVDRKSPREFLRQSLDAIFAEKLDRKVVLDSVESKLFGIGSESCVFGSHEFYLGYALTNGTLLTLDTGHFHPTETVSDKITAILAFLDGILLHVSRGVRWDSDHVVILSDELRSIAEEICRNAYLDRVHIGLDFFDASINRIAAWVTGARAMIKALLLALIEPTDTLRALERAGDYTARLVMHEEVKSLPFGAVWDYFCLKQAVPPNAAWLNEVKTYEREVLSKRS